MNWLLWLIAAILAAALFALGAVYERSRATVHAVGAHPTTRRSRREARLGVLFTVLAIVIAADTIWLQVRFSRFTHAAVDCNTARLNADQAVNDQRRKVDDLAAQYDVAMVEYLRTASTKELIPTDDMSYINVQDKLHSLMDARLLMIETYARHPPPDC